MITKKILVRPIIMAGYCDKCGGRLRETGLVFTTYPAIYEYMCEECGHRQESSITLNQLSYEELEEIEDNIEEGSVDDEEVPFP